MHLREDEIMDRVEDWIPKVDRLARHGSDYELAPVYKIAALQHMLIGESKKLFQQWKLEGMSFEKLLAKLRDYARGQQLDGDANKLPGPPRVGFILRCLLV